MPTGPDILGNSARAWLTAIAIAVALTIAGKLIVHVAIRRLRALAARTATLIDDLVVGVLASTKVLLLAALSLYAGSSVLVLPPRLGDWLGTGAMLVLFAQIGIWANRLINLLLEAYQKSNPDSDGAPFLVCDFIVLDTFAGTVERVGLKTTRVRSLSGEQLVFANSDLLASRIRNFKRMTERRVVLTFGVVYGTSVEQLESIPPLVRAIVEARPEARFERAHFRNFGASSLDFEAVYFVRQPDYPAFMDLQQTVNLELFRAFADAGIEFAYPTQMVHVKTLSAS